MPAPPPFPSSIEELTPAFLSDALGVPIDRFSADRIGADRGMLGVVFRLAIEPPLADGATAVVAKFAALREGSLASARRGRNNERELLCYEQLLADTPVRTPALHGAWYDEATAHYLLLQESIDVDTSVDQIRGLSGSQGERVVDEMAAFHVRWWGDPGLANLDWLPRLDGPDRLHNLSTLCEAGWDPLVEILGDDAPAVPAGFGAALPERLRQALQSLAELPSTLIHCDLRADNLLFDPDDGTVTLVDWQGCGVGPAAFDLAYFLTQSLSVEDRRRHETRLTDRWVDRLATDGEPITDPLAGFDQSLWYGMAIACALPVISDPDEPRVRELALAVATRTIAALADHGQLDP